MLEAIIRDTLKNSTPIILAATGGLLTEVSGWLNIGLEGGILSGAFFAVVVSSATGSILLGTLASVIVAVILSTIVFLTVRFLKANLYVVGIAANLLSVGLVGVKLRACGYDDESAFYSGVKVNQIRFMAYFGSGVFAGLAGSALSLPLGAFVSNMSGGRGWLALVAVIMGRKNPVLVFLSAIMLGFVTELSIFLQVATEVSPKLLLSLPYFVSFVILALSHSGNSKKSLPLAK
ncbi:MAG: Inner-membrane translocator [Mesotoga infera]|uniref:Inner-membrane translocator n=1 Tax=Mesotoga infera TaxID=1236046 RepID=A0A101I7T3_9BACT|nr:MAG: Inner-membrane translocator [Mesotoga infera]